MLHYLSVGVQRGEGRPPPACNRIDGRVPAAALPRGNDLRQRLENAVLFVEVLRQCVGQIVLLNDREERTLLRVEDDFLVLQGGNPQLRLTEFIPFAQITRMTRSEYVGGTSALCLNIALSGGEMNRDDSCF